VAHSECTSQPITYVRGMKVNSGQKCYCPQKQNEEYVYLVVIVICCACCVDDGRYC